MFVILLQDLDILHTGRINFKTQTYISRRLYIFTKNKIKSPHMSGDHLATVLFCVQRSKYSLIE